MEACVTSSKGAFDLITTHKFSMLQTAIASWFITWSVPETGSPGKWSWHQDYQKFKKHLDETLKSHDLEF